MTTADPAPAPSLASFASPLRALVFGAAGGLGAALATELAGHPRVGRVYSAARSASPPWNFTLQDEASIAAVVTAAAAEGPLDLVIVATGVLHNAQLRPEKSWRSLDAAALAEAFAVNATGPALIAKHALGHLRRDAKSAFACLSARVGSIEDNRLGGWHAYRASKAEEAEDDEPNASSPEPSAEGEALWLRSTQFGDGESAASVAALRDVDELDQGRSHRPWVIMVFRYVP